MSKQVLQNNSDFLFIYEAIQCNPNGDPDQENKPRMDYDTKTNLVTDVRLKRYLRNYLKETGHDIFVDMEGDSKVGMDTKMLLEIDRLFEGATVADLVFANEPELRKKFDATLKGLKKGESVSALLKKASKKGSKQDKEQLAVNRHILDYLVKQKFIDIRLFGSAFAVEGFNQSYTGPVQINWGYSLHPVELMESNSLVTIMNDDSSTFGKDYRVNYSLLAFHGTMNRYQAQHSQMTIADREVLRKAMWQAIPTQLSRSKQNQYPKLYVELVYADGHHNGQLGDLRQYVQANPAPGKTDKQIRSLQDLTLNFAPLQEQINALKQQGVLKEVIVKTAPGLQFNLEG